ncbi:MAG: ribonuclease HI family protein, partial [Candidatus Veblenbacteria bacterium]|nr:ribonuclease HI family protein [Candidatus Veblenbacteria bacterium]
MAKVVTIRTDGGARGNPGPAAIGVVIEDGDGKVIMEFGRYLGEKTNNQAEYQALLVALEEAKGLGATEVRCYLDSELVVKQLKQEYRVKDKELASLFVKVLNLGHSFKQVSYHHVRREQNKRADALVNRTL